jgi:hypothetical protein
MAKFLTITQRGYTFVVHDADKLIADEEWTIERVASFMSLHNVLNTSATRYSKGITFRPAIATIMYTLNCDSATSKDLDKLSRYLIPKISDSYNDADRQSLLGKPLATVLDALEQAAITHVQEAEAPMTVFGKEVPQPRFYQRPTEQEYNAELERATAQEKRYWDNFKSALSEGRALHHKILIRDGSNVYTGTITGVTAKCVYCDMVDEYGRLIQKDARLPKDSSRFIIESFR